jgi:hypothetical protein
MELSLSWEADGFTTTNKLLKTLWDQKIHYCVYKSSALSHVNPAYIVSFYSSKAH